MVNLSLIHKYYQKGSLFAYLVRRAKINFDLKISSLEDHPELIY